MQTPKPLLRRCEIDALTTLGCVIDRFLH